MKLRLALVVCVLAGCPFSYGKSEFLELFLKTYHISEDSALGQKSCAICHASEDDFTKFNPYGRDLKKTMADLNKAEVDLEVLRRVEPAFSAGDGTTNFEKISKGKAPGETIAGAQAAAPASAPPVSKPLVPKSFFHPAVVHFPIALFITGLVLDLLGLIYRQQRLLQAGWFNICGAALTSFAAIATGIGAMYMQHLPYKGLIFRHLTLAASAAVIMLILVGMRMHRHERMHLPSRVIYYLLAAAGLVLISYAGHLGGAFVYGD